MKHQIATSREQSERLLKCGIDPKTADFVWMDDTPDNPRLTLHTEIIEAGNPYILALAWSLSALLDLLPKEVYDADSNEPYYFSLSQDFPLKDDYSVAYVFAWGEADDLFSVADESPIEACVKAIEWLTQNGFKLNQL